MDLYLYVVFWDRAACRRPVDLKIKIFSDNFGKK
jgi:hypothetical protein